ncbi:MAG: ribose transport system permease protein [Verrucomicrobiota bacterium]|jgi:ribose transport system permease protein
MASPPGSRRRWLNQLSPFFGLFLVVTIFAASLAVTDVAAERKKNPGSWMAAARKCSYDGFNAFISISNFKTVLVQTVIVALGALGMTLIIVGGGIDLSAGSSVALTSVLAATLLLRGLPPTIAVALTLLAGGFIGLLNGALIAGFRMIPFIVTLGMMGICRGVAKWIANNQTVNAPENSKVSDLMMSVDLDHLFPLPAGVWLAVALGIVLSVVMRQTVFGRHVFALGSNEMASRLSGIRVHRQKVLIYSLAGCFFGCAGLMQMARLSQGDPSGAVGLELDMIAAVVVGGASLSGGTGSVLGSMIGALVIQTLRAGSSLMNWPTFTQEIIIGAVIILAVGLDRWRHAKG